jgi:hypothetical protein
VASGKPISRWKRIFGYILVGFGILSIIDFFSPIPIPTTFLGAFFTGTIAIVLGAWLLTGGGWLARMSRSAATRGPLGSRQSGRVAFDPQLPVEILRLAAKHGGILTQSTVATELNVPLDQASAALEECVRQGSAFHYFDIGRQHPMYRFPEFTPRRDRPAGDGSAN